VAGRIMKKILSVLFRKKWVVIGRVESADEIPLSIALNCAYVVGNKNKPKWIIFDCPCGTGHRIFLNTDPSRTPMWKIVGRFPLSIMPSIDYKNGSKRCHYIIKNGKVIWITERRSDKTSTRR
jgi:hypothetical protein